MWEGAKVGAKLIWVERFELEGEKGGQTKQNIEKERGQRR